MPPTRSHLSLTHRPARPTFMIGGTAPLIQGRKGGTQTSAGSTLMRCEGVGRRDELYPTACQYTVPEPGPATSSPDHSRQNLRDSGVLSLLRGGQSAIDSGGCTTPSQADRGSCVRCLRRRISSHSDPLPSNHSCPLGGRGLGWVGGSRHESETPHVVPRAETSPSAVCFGAPSAGCCQSVRPGRVRGAGRAPARCLPPKRVPLVSRRAGGRVQALRA